MKKAAPSPKILCFEKTDDSFPDQAWSGRLPIRLVDFNALDGQLETRSHNVYLIHFHQLEKFMRAAGKGPYSVDLYSQSVVYSEEPLPPDKIIELYEEGFHYVHSGPGAGDRLEDKISDLLAKKSDEVSSQLLMGRIMQKLKIQKKQLAHQNDLFQMAVHDLKSPLSAMICYAEMLLDGVLDEFKSEENKPIKIIHQNCKFLIGMVDDLLESAMIKAGKKELVLTNTAINPIVEKVIHYLRGLASVKNIQVKMELGNLPEIRAQAKMMERVIINLYSNAVKFTKTGGTITVKTFCRGSQVVFSIQDDGPGIRKTDIAKIFDKFSVGDDRGIKGKGHGLGLAITKAFVELQEGHILVKSKRHKGSTFLAQFNAVSTDPSVQTGGVERAVILDFAEDFPELATLEGLNNMQVEYKAARDLNINDLGLNNISCLIINDTSDPAREKQGIIVSLLHGNFIRVPCFLLTSKYLNNQGMELYEYISVYLLRKPIDLTELQEKITAVLKGKAA